MTVNLMTEIEWQQDPIEGYESYAAYKADFEQVQLSLLLAGFTCIFYG